MLIKKIEMENFRQFKDKNIIELATGAEKNITLIIANNGMGKTTLSQAFLWCLYGENEFKNKKLLNLDVENMIISGIYALKYVRVVLFVQQNENDYIITRRQNYVLKGRGVSVSSETFGVSVVENGNERELNHVQSELFIKKILPKELSKFFFFGGERIETMSNEIKEGKSKQFMKAVNGLAGLTAITNAIRHLKALENTFNKEMDEQGDASLTSYTKQINEFHDNIREKEARLEEIGPELNIYEKKQEELREELYSYGKALEVKENINAIEIKINLKRKEKTENIKQLLLLFSSKTLDFMSLPLIKTALEELKDMGKLDKGIPDMRDTTIKFLLDRKLCICGNSLDIGTDAYCKVYDLLDILPPKSIGQLLGEFSDVSRTRIRNAENYFSSFEKSFTDIRRNTEDLEAMEAEKSDLLQMISDTSRVQYLKLEIENIENNKQKTNREYVEVEESIKKLKAKLREIIAQKETLVNISVKNSALLRYKAYTMEVKRQFDKEYKDEEQKVRVDLEHRINEFLDNIFDGVIKIELDSKYNITTMMTEKAHLYEKSSSDIEESTAQGYSVIFAFISALIEMAKEKARIDMKNWNELSDIEKGDANLEIQEAYPLVMDAPLSVFDKTRIKHLCNILPEIADQVVFFIKDTDGEIAEEYLSDRIGIKYELVKDNISSMVTNIERR